MGKRYWLSTGQMLEVWPIDSAGNHMVAVLGVMGGTKAVIHFTEDDLLTIMAVFKEAIENPPLLPEGLR